MSKRTHHTRKPTIQSNTYRFFIDPDAFHGRSVLIEDRELLHQFSSVLRLRTGAQVVLLDNTGWQYIVTLDVIDRNKITGTIERKELASGEPRTKLTLYTSLLRAERFEWVLQKGTELGVSAFIPLICERSTIADADELSTHKLERWERIIREAAEQARRAKLPRLTPAMLLPSACEQAVQRGPSILLWEGHNAYPLQQILRAPATTGRLQQGEQQHTMAPGHERHQPTPTTGRSFPSTTPFSVALFSGPEGGFTHEEHEIAQGYGLISATLGPRTLRAETAPIAAAAVILYEMGDLG